MKYKKCLIFLCFFVCVFSIASVCASDANETIISNENEQQIMEQVNDNVDLSSPSHEDLISNENSSLISKSSDNDVLSINYNSDVLAASSSNKVVKSDSSTKKTVKTSLIMSAPKVTNFYKKGTFKVTLKDKKTKKPVNGIKLNIKVYTGKKYKNYSVKTNKKGVATISTKSLSKATHKVVITAKATKKYNGKTIKSSIIIKNKNTASSNTKANQNQKTSSSANQVKTNNNPSSSVSVHNLMVEPEFDKYVRKTVGEYTLEVTKWRGYSVGGFGAFLYKNGKLMDRYSYQSRAYFCMNGVWKWSDWSYGGEGAVYHKYPVSNDVEIKKVEVKF